MYVTPLRKFTRGCTAYLHSVSYFTSFQPIKDHLQHRKYFRKWSIICECLVEESAVNGRFDYNMPSIMNYSRVATYSSQPLTARSSTSDWTIFDHSHHYFRSWKWEAMWSKLLYATWPWLSCRMGEITSNSSIIYYYVIKFLIRRLHKYFLPSPDQFNVRIFYLFLTVSVKCFWS